MTTSVLPEMATLSVSITLIPSVEVVGTNEEDTNSSSQGVLMIVGVIVAVAAVLVVVLTAATLVIVVAKIRTNKNMETNKSVETKKVGTEEQTNDYTVSGM